MPGRRAKLILLFVIVGQLPKALGGGSAGHLTIGCFKPSWEAGSIPLTCPGCVTVRNRCWSDFSPRSTPLAQANHFRDRAPPACPRRSSAGSRDCARIGRRLAPGVYYINAQAGPINVRYFLGIPAQYDLSRSWPLVVKLPVANAFLTQPPPDAQAVTDIYTQWITRANFPTIPMPSS